MALGIIAGAQTVHADTSDPQAPSVQASIQPTTALLGDVLTLQITVMHHAAYTLQPPVLPKTIGTFEVMASTALATDVRGAELTEHFVAQLQNFSTGPQLLPGIDFSYTDLDRQSHALKTPPVTVILNEVQPGSKDKKGEIRGIKGVIGPIAWSPWWWLLLVVGILAAAAHAWHRRERKIQGPPPPPPVPADELALQKLEELKASGWIESGLLKEFYSALSDIVRAYIENGFKVPALERTTNELMRDLRKKNSLDAVRQGELKTLLEACDLVKFAKFRPKASEALSDHEAAVRFVGDTRHAFRES